MSGDVRHPACVSAWPECIDGEYHPDCCRFPKSCSCATVWPTEKRAAVADDRELHWCSTHGEPAWLYGDGSMQCMYDLIVERCSNDHILVPISVNFADT